MTEPTYTETQILSALKIIYPMHPRAGFIAALRQSAVLDSYDWQREEAAESPAQPPTTHEYCPDLDYDNTEKCGFRVSMSGDWCNKQREDPVHVQRGADTPQPEPAEGFAEFQVREVAETIRSFTRRDRPSKPPEFTDDEWTRHCDVIAATAETFQASLIRGYDKWATAAGADVPTTEPPAEGALAQCWDCDLHLPKAEMRRIDTTSGWQWRCAACQPSAGTSPTTPERTPGPCCQQELIDVADALIDTPEQHGWIKALRARANGPRFAHLDQRDTSRDWSREPTVGELGIAHPPQFTPDDYPEDRPGRDTHRPVRGWRMKWPRWFKRWLGVGHSPSAHTSGGAVHCPTCPKNRQPKFDRWS